MNFHLKNGVPKGRPARSGGRRGRTSRHTFVRWSNSMTSRHPDRGVCCAVPGWCSRAGRTHRCATAAVDWVNIRTDTIKADHRLAALGETLCRLARIELGCQPQNRLSIYRQYWGPARVREAEKPLLVKFDHGLAAPASSTSRIARKCSPGTSSSYGSGVPCSTRQQMPDSRPGGIPRRRATTPRWGRLLDTTRAES